MTHHSVYFGHDCTFCRFDSLSTSDEADFSLNVAATGWRNVDLASSMILHVLDGLSAFANDHANGIARHQNGVVDLLVWIVTVPTAQLFDADTFLITLNNFVNEILGVSL